MVTCGLDLFKCLMFLSKKLCNARTGLLNILAICYIQNQLSITYIYQ